MIIEDEMAGLWSMPKKTDAADAENEQN